MNMGTTNWRRLRQKHHYSFYRLAAGTKSSPWRWDLFVVYLGSMALLLVVLPALFAGSGAVTPPTPRPEEISREPLLPLPASFTKIQVYVVEGHERVEMDLEVYLAGVVAAEMPPAFHKEALKAQAVAARTYTLQKMRSAGGRGCNGHMDADLCTDSTCCQAWDNSAAQAMVLKGVLEDDGRDEDDLLIRKIGTEKSSPFYERVMAAVNETRGVVLNYGGTLIEAVYHSSCGGITAAASEVWERDFPYLQPVQDHYCSHSPYYRQEVRMELASFLRSIGMSMDDRAAVPVLAGQEPLLEVSRQGPSGRNTLLRLPPAEQEIFLRGSEFRSTLGLPSTFFQWHLENDEIVFLTRGFGHGVGLCQYGADGMARAGFNFEEILAHYYPGTVLNTYRR